MTTTTPSPRATAAGRPTTPGAALGRAISLQPRLAMRAREIESGRRVPADVLDDLKEAGCFRLLLPESHGGMGADIVAMLDVLESLAVADASTAWTVMIGGGGFVDLVGLPRATFDSMYAAGPDAIVAGAFSPSGAATAVDSGFEVSGRWGFASGCQHAMWLYGNCVVDGGEGGLRIVLLTPDDVTIEDTWHVSGLKGTGSHHFTVAPSVVPVERTVPVMTAEPCVDAPIAFVHTPALFSVMIAGVALGAARGALDDIIGIADGKVPLLSTAALRHSPAFHASVSQSDTTVRAMRTLLRDDATLLWQAASERRPLTDIERARVRSDAAWVVDRAASVVTAAYRSGGGSALYDDSPLQRRLRDVSAITQHFLVRPDTAAKAGGLLIGEALDLPVF